MKQLLLTLSIFIGISVGIKAQCPTAGFLMPDSVCIGSSVVYQNTSTGINPLKYEWDLSIGDLSNNPTGNVLGNFASNLTSSLGIDYVVSNDSIFAVSITNSGILTVFSFGNSINNIPTTTTYTNLGGIQGGWDLEIATQDSNHVVFLAGLFNNVIYQVKFGSSFQNVPVISTLSSSLYNWPAGIKTVYDQGNCYILSTNFNGNELVISNLGNSFENNIISTTSIPIPTNSFGITTIKDCNNWYGYVGSLVSPSVTVIDFGTSITSSPISVTNNVFSLPYNSRKCFSINDGSDWYLLFCSANKNAISKVKLGTSASNINPVITDLGSFGTYTSHFATAFHKIGSSFEGLATNFDVGDLSRFTFTDNYSESISEGISPDLVFNSMGNHFVGLTVVDSITGNLGLFTDSIYVKPKPSPSFELVVGCEDVAISLIDTSNYTLGLITSQVWDLGDLTQLSGDTIQHIYSTFGAYPVTLTSTNDVGCSTSYSDTINIYRNPMAGFTFTNPVCAGVDVNFNSTSTSIDGLLQIWNWNFDGVNSLDTNPKHTFLTDGIFPVKLVVTTEYGCTDSLTQNETIIPGPFSSFSVSNSCIGETAFFNNQSTISSGLTLNSTWDFGDNTSSSTNSPLHTYSNIPSTYFVQLISEATNGCKDTITDSIRIGIQPIPNFTSSKDTACALNDIIFTDLSTSGIGESIIHRYWDFGDGQFDSLSINPIHQYSLPGSYNVTLTVVSPSYCDSVITKSILVIESPKVFYSGNNVCFGLPTNFKDSTVAPIGSTLATWNWHFGDNDSASIQNPIHTYSTPGVYNVNLIVTNSFGCTGNASKSISVYNNPIASFTNTKACTANNISFNDSSNVLLSTINSWKWDFGDLSAPSNLQNPGHIYNNSAAYPISLVVTSTDGCIDTVIKYIIVDKSPEYNISATSNCLGTVSNYHYIPIGSPSTNQGYTWNFGDSTFAFQPNPIHLYISPGNYPISLTIVDLNNTCSTKVIDTINIYNTPNAQFSSIPNCVNDSIKFKDLSVIQSDTITSWNWNWGAYGTSISQNPYLILSNADSFPVKLTVTSNKGCKDSITHYSQSYKLPFVNFTASPLYGPPPLPIQFTNLSDPGSYTWDFGDGGANSGLINPLYVYSDTGTFKASLIVVDNNRCIDSLSTVINVLKPYLDLSLENINLYQENSFWKISATVRNTGILEINKFSLATRIQDATRFTEEFQNILIPSGSLRNIKFNISIPVSSLNTPEYYCINIDYVNGRKDDYVGNDLKCVNSSSQFSIYSTFPNPFKDDFQVELSIPENGNLSYRIFNVMGETILKSQNIESNKGYNLIEVPMQNFSNGVYFIEMNFEEKIIRKQIVKM